MGQLLKERIGSFQSEFLPFRVDPILEGLHMPGKQTGSHSYGDGKKLVCKHVGWL